MLGFHGEIHAGPLRALTIGSDVSPTSITDNAYSPSGVMYTVDTTWYDEVAHILYLK
jgi:hypothetical protein